MFASRATGGLGFFFFFMCRNRFEYLGVVKTEVAVASVLPAPSLLPAPSRNDGFEKPEACPMRFESASAS